MLQISLSQIRGVFFVVILGIPGPCRIKMFKIKYFCFSQPQSIYIYLITYSRLVHNSKRKTLMNNFLLYFLITFFLISCNQDNQDPDKETLEFSSSWSAEHDPSFEIGSGISRAYDIVEHNDQYLVSGREIYNGFEVGPVFRISKDGSLDPFFNSRNSFTGTKNIVTKILKLKDGNLLVIGRFTANNSNSTQNVAILTNDGSIEESFSPTDDWPKGYSLMSCVEDQQGRILVGGEEHFEGVKNMKLYRLLRNGVLDTTFNALFNGNIADVKVDINNKIWVGGSFLKVNGVNSNYIAILNEDGSVYKTTSELKDPRWLIFFVTRIEFQKEGKAIVGGSFDYTIDGKTYNNIARFNLDLTLDVDFKREMKNDAWGIFDLTLTESDEIIYGGLQFFGMTDASGVQIETFKADTLNSPSGVVVQNILLDNEKRLVLAGLFSDYGTVKSSGLLRLKGKSK